MTYELDFEEVLFDNGYQLEGDLYIRVEPELEESSLDPYGAFPDGKGFDVIGFKVIEAILHYQDRFDNDKEIKLSHKEVVESVGYATIVNKLQKKQKERENECPFS